MSQKHHVLGTHTHSHLVSTLVKAVNSSMLAVSQGYVSKIHWAQNPWTLETHCLINTQRHHNREKISSHFSPLYFSTFSRVASSSFWVQTSASWAQLAKGHLEVVRGDCHINPVFLYCFISPSSSFSDVANCSRLEGCTFCCWLFF